jgi:hypothetical protein
VKRAVSRDGHWSPNTGDSFAKIHSGLATDDSIAAASERQPINALAVPNDGCNGGLRISDFGLAGCWPDSLVDPHFAVNSGSFAVLQVHRLAV